MSASIATWKRRLTAAARLPFDERLRIELRARLSPPHGAHQVSTYTREDRYPALFSALREAVGDRAVRVLSVGCSTGEELRALREYLPAAVIVGTDVNKHALAVARRESRDANTVIVEPAKLVGRFDVIVCASVLQRSATRRLGVSDTNVVYPFAAFESALARLDTLLAPGGVLLLHHADYRLRDTALAARYEALEGAIDATWHAFTPDGTWAAPGPALFRKLADGPEGSTDRALHTTGALAHTLMLVEAITLLTWSRLAVAVLPFKTFAPLLGDAGRESGDAGLRGPGPWDHPGGATVVQAAAGSPYGAVCLPQGATAKLRLARRGITSTLYLGVRRGKSDIEAHAWLRAGGAIVTGAAEHATFARLTSFA